MSVITLGQYLDVLKAGDNEVLKAQAIELDHTTHYRWLKDDPDYSAAVAELDNIVIDLAEAALLSKIKEGDTTAIIFFLKTKGRKRGYIETKTIESADGGPLKIIIDSLI